MTRSLSDELRQLAEIHGPPGSGHTTDLLRRAAEALDDLALADDERLKYQTWLYERNGELSQCKAQRDFLKAQLAANAPPKDTSEAAIADINDTQRLDIPGLLAKAEASRSKD